MNQGTRLPRTPPREGESGASGRYFYAKADLALGARASVSPDSLEGLSSGRGGELADLRPLNEAGTFNELFMATDGSGDLIVKARVVDFLPRSVDVERAVADTLGSAGVPHVAVHLSDSSCSQASAPYLVMDVAEGTSLRAIDGDDAAVRPTLATQARLLRAVHSVEARGFGPVVARDDTTLVAAERDWRTFSLVRLEDHLDVLTSAGLIDDATAAQSRTLLGAVDQSASSVLLHGDCGPHNFVVNGGECVLLDWEDALVGPPDFDVAMWCTFAPERRWQEFFDAYYVPSWQPGRAFWESFLRIAIAKSVVRHRLGIQDKPGRPPAILRVTRAVEALRDITQ